MNTTVLSVNSKDEVIVVDGAPPIKPETLKERILKRPISKEYEAALKSEAESIGLWLQKLHTMKQQDLLVEAKKTVDDMKNYTANGISVAPLNQKRMFARVNGYYSYKLMTIVAAQNLKMAQYKLTDALINCKHFRGMHEDGKKSNVEDWDYKCLKDDHDDIYGNLVNILMAARQEEAQARAELEELLSKEYRRRMEKCTVWYHHNLPNVKANIKETHISLATGNPTSVDALSALNRAFNKEGKLVNEIIEINFGRQQVEKKLIGGDDHNLKVRVGNAVGKYVSFLLETELNMTKIEVSGPTEGAETSIYATPEYDTKETLMVLIHSYQYGSAGQWSTGLIMTDGLDKGSQIPYIKQAISRNYGVIIIKPNFYEKTGKNSPEEHAKRVWKEYIKNTSATSILIVAHSYGGVVTMTLANNFKDDFKKRVKGIALADSTHAYSTETPDFLIKISKNWVSSEKPLDTPIERRDNGAGSPMVSAGHPKQEWAPCSSMDSVFKFLDEIMERNANGASYYTIDDQPGEQGGNIGQFLHKIFLTFFNY